MLLDAPPTRLAVVAAARLYKIIEIESFIDNRASA
jgi:hypothetical protein